MPFHVLTVAFVHERNTFKKGETTLQDFLDNVLDVGQVAVDRFRGVNEELAGFIDVAEAEGWRVTHTVSAHATPGARVAREAYEHIAGPICESQGASGQARRRAAGAARVDGPGLLRGWRRRASGAPARHPWGRTCRSR